MGILLSGELSSVDPRIEDMHGTNALEGSTERSIALNEHDVLCVFHVTFWHVTLLMDEGLHRGHTGARQKAR